MPQNNQDSELGQQIPQIYGVVRVTPYRIPPDRRTLGDQQWSASYQARHRQPGQQHRQAEQQGETSSQQS